ncbi:MMPL family transporter [Streptomyces sp. SID3343]|uniref:MMPL family transporter n=1 Tax=Streptomyces sp. SID3343 TaxID=2690260 RepID=UPI001F019D1B|nr:MMPL family transporter [Streptomyces sp. SID3343]
MDQHLGHAPDGFREVLIGRDHQAYVLDRFGGHLRWLTDIVPVPKVGPVVSFLPIPLIAVLFGLAMDYELFLVSRMKEERAHGAEPKQAIIAGFTGGARVVTAAALIMIAVFGSFVFSPRSTWRAKSSPGPGPPHNPAPNRRTPDPHIPTPRDLEAFLGAAPPWCGPPAVRFEVAVLPTDIDERLLCVGALARTTVESTIEGRPRAVRAACYRAGGGTGGCAAGRRGPCNRPPRRTVTAATRANAPLPGNGTEHVRQTLFPFVTM